MIVNYFEPVLNFNLPPEQAIAYFSQKGLKPTYSYLDMLKGEHDRAFTVAKMMDIDLLETVQKSMKDALANGESLQTFKKKLTPTLEKAGWWGKKEVVNADGSISKIQLGSSSRLDTIYRTNMQSAYAAGHWQAIQEQKEFMPYLMYDAVDDSATRQEHAALDGIVKPVDDVFWTYAMPLNGYNCRCGTIQMDSDMLEQYGLSITKSSDIPSIKGIPKGVDSNFAHNPGIGFMDILDDIQNKKIAKMDPSSANAAKTGVKANKEKAEQIKKAQLALEAEKIAQEQLAKAKVIENANKQLDEIAQGNSPKQSTIKMKLLEKYKKAGIDDPVATLAKIVKEAAEAQEKSNVSSLLSAFKKKVIAGKLPTNKQQQIFDNLSDDKKAKLLADIDKAKAIASQKLNPLDEAYKLDMRNMKPTSGQLGSNPGAMYYDEETGIDWYIKKPPTDDHARNEVLAAKLYESAGIEVPNVQLIKDAEGNLRVASQIIDNLEANGKKLASGKVKNVNEGFVVDSWLANWDVVGLNYDNMLIKHNRAIRLDTGGALLFRAQGGRKGSDFGVTVNEIETLRNVNVNPKSASVFSSVTERELSDSVGKLAAIDKDEIKALVKKFGPGTLAERENLAGVLLQRRQFLIKKLQKQKYNEKQYQLAQSQLKSIAKEQINDIDNQLVATLKGIAFNFDKEGIRTKDVNRFVEFKAALDNLLVSGKLSPKSARELRAHYSVWIDEIDNSIQNNVPLSGNFYQNYSGAFIVSEDAIQQLAETFGDLPPTSSAAAARIIDNYLGKTAFKFKVPSHGAAEYQEAFAKLTENHKRSISAYTGSYYRSLNSQLYNRNATPQAIAFRDLLNEAIEYSDDYVGLSARGMSFDTTAEVQAWVESHRNAYNKKSPFKYLAFTSSTKGSVPAFGGQVKMLIHGKSGTWVNPISINEGVENEVLLGARATFVVQKIEETSPNNYTIVIKEIDSVDVPTDMEFNEYA